MYKYLFIILSVLISPMLSLANQELQFVTCEECYYSACKAILTDHAVKSCEERMTPTVVQTGKFPQIIAAAEEVGLKKRFEADLKKQGNELLDNAQKQMEKYIRCHKSPSKSKPECAETRQEIQLVANYLYPLARSTKSVATMLKNPVFYRVGQTGGGGILYGGEEVVLRRPTVFQYEEEKKSFSNPYTDIEKEVAFKIFKQIDAKFFKLPYGSDDRRNYHKRIAKDLEETSNSIVRQFPFLKHANFNSKTGKFEMPDEKIVKQFEGFLKQVTESKELYNTEQADDKSVLYNDRVVSTNIAKLIGDGKLDEAKSRCFYAERMHKHFDQKEFAKSLKFFGTTLTGTGVCLATAGYGCVMMVSAAVEGAYVYHRYKKKEQSNRLYQFLDPNKAEKESANFTAALLLSPLAVLGNGSLPKKAMAKLLSKISSTVVGSVVTKPKMLNTTHWIEKGFSGNMKRACRSLSQRNMLTELYGDLNFCK